MEDVKYKNTGVVDFVDNLVQRKWRSLCATSIRILKGKDKDEVIIFYTYIKRD